MAVNLHPKMSASVVAGAITSLVVAETNRRGFALAPDEASALTVLLSFIAGYFMPTDDGGQNGVPAVPVAVVAAPAPLPPVAPAAPSFLSSPGTPSNPMPMRLPETPANTIAGVTP
jgi:hypothetical protein